MHSSHNCLHDQYTNTYRLNAISCILILEDERNKLRKTSKTHDLKKSGDISTYMKGNFT